MRQKAAHRLRWPLLADDVGLVDVTFVASRGSVANGFGDTAGMTWSCDKSTKAQDGVRLAAR